MGRDGDGDRNDEEDSSNDRHDKMGGRGGRKMQVSVNRSQKIQHGTSVTLQIFPTTVPSKLRIRTFLMVSVCQYLWFLAFYVTFMINFSSTPSQIQDYTVVILTAIVILTVMSVFRWKVMIQSRLITLSVISAV
jgi:hypothetical protein